MIKVRHHLETHLVFMKDGTGRFGLIDFARRHPIAMQERPSPPARPLSPYQRAAQEQRERRRAAEERLETRPILSVVSS